MKIINADVLAGLAQLEDSSVHCCVTSPPYWGLRDYGHDGQIGLEPTPEAYVARMVEVFRAVRRVLREDGTLWLNLGDSYASSGRSDRKESPGVGAKQEMKAPGRKLEWEAGGGHNFSWFIPSFGTRIKPKDLVGIPWRVAFALQADGWWLRQDIIWHKPNPMPESVRDRCTKAHEYVFLLTKSERYFYDAEAVSEPANASHAKRYESEFNVGKKEVARGEWSPAQPNTAGKREFTGTRNRRSVWTIAPKPYKGAHFAVMPPDLVEPCILAGSPKAGIVLDPFAGSGTTLAVAMSLRRDAIGIELNPDYIPLIEQRIEKTRDKMGVFAA